MKKITILFLSIITISCTKDSTILDSLSDNKFVIKSITYQSDKLTYTEDIFYDKNWRILKIKNQWQEYDFEYSKNEISKIKFKNGEGFGIHEVSYGKIGNITSTYTTYFENKTYSSTSNFELNDKNQIIKFSNDIYRLNINYDNSGNIIQIFNNENTFELKNNTFDSNNNPFAKYYQKWLLLNFLRSRFTNTVSINNPVSSTIKYSNNNKINVSYINLEFDNDKNLISLERKSDNKIDEYVMLFKYVSIE
jgi:hypothetical protein